MQDETFDYTPVRDLILSGKLSSESGAVVWELVDHARALESALACKIAVAAPEFTVKRAASPRIEMTASSDPAFS